MKKSLKILNRILILVVLVGGAGLLLTSLFATRGDRSYSLEYGNINITVEATALIVRDETVVQTQSSGAISYMVAEGEKTKRRQVVAMIEPGVPPTGEAQNTPVVSQDEVQISLETLEYEIAFLRSKIRYAIINDRFGTIHALREELELKLDRADRLSLLATAPPVISETTGSDAIQLTAPESGVVSYYIDGYEDVLTDANLFAVDFERLLTASLEPVNHSAQFVMANDVVYKLVDSNHWKLVALVDEREMDYFSKGQVVDVQFEDSKAQGQVVEMIAQEEHRALVIEMQELISDFQKQRRVDVEIHPSNFRGLLIENTSLVKQDGRYGVYVLNVNNQSVFVPVKIIGYDQEKAIVFSDSFLEDGSRISTVSLYDEIIRDASTVQQE